MGICRESVAHCGKGATSLITRSASCSNLSTTHNSLSDDMHIRSQMEIKATARLLAEDIISYMTVSPTPPVTCDHALTLRRVVDEVSSRHQLVFESIVRKVGVQAVDHQQDAAVCRRTFNAVANELFADGHYNWGRVIVLYAFAAWLAKHPNGSLSEGGNDKLSKSIASAAGEFVANKLSSWICHQGGWDTMEIFFEQHESMHSSIWRGLIVTLFFLGTLALVASLNR